MGKEGGDMCVGGECASGRVLRSSRRIRREREVLGCRDGIWELIPRTIVGQW